MIVKGSKTVQEDFELSRREVRRICLEMFDEMFIVGDDLFIEDGKVIISVEHHGGQHSWEEDQVIRDVTGFDNEAINIRCEFSNRLRNWRDE